MKKLLLFIVIDLMLIGCGPKKPNLQEVATPPKPLIQKGFSFTPLDERGWYILGRNSFNIALARQGNSKDETRAIQGMVLKSNTFKSDDAFVQAVKKAQANDTDSSNPERFKVISNDTVAREHKGEACAFSHILSEDHKAIKRSRGDGVMLLEIYTLVCRHPQNRNAVVNVGYSERYYPQQRSSDMESKANKLLESVNFEPL